MDHKITTIIIFNILVLCFIPGGHAADEDPLQDACIADLSSTVKVNGFVCKKESATSADFFSSKLTKGGNTDNPNGSNATVMDVTKFPGLNTQGISMNRVDFAKGGINPPHVHPRASELGRVEKGQLLVGILDTHNNYFSKVVKAGESFVIPRGVLHFQLNVGTGEATQFVSFDSQVPGIIFIAQTLFGSTPAISTEVLAKTFRTDNATIEKLRSGFISNGIDTEIAAA